MPREHQEQVLRFAQDFGRRLSLRSHLLNASTWSAATMKEISREADHAVSACTRSRKT